MINTCRALRHTVRFKDVNNAYGRTLNCFRWLFEGKSDRGLARKIIDFIVIALFNHCQNAAEIIGDHRNKADVGFDAETLEIIE